MLCYILSSIIFLTEAFRTKCIKKADEDEKIISKKKDRRMELLCLVMDCGEAGIFVAL